MKNKKKIMMANALVSIIVLGVFMLCMWKHFTDYNTALHANWEISIPAKAHYSEIYRKDSGASFHGDGIRYHIFSYKDHTPISKMLSWEKDKEQSLFYGQYSNAVNIWLDEIDVPFAYRPDYSACLYWHDLHDDNSEIIFLWNREKNTIYVAESFL